MPTEYFERLSKDTKIVSHARFNKSKRLARKSWWSFFSITSLSISMILIAICDARLSDQLKNISIFFIEKSMPTWVLTTTTSIILLVISVAISLAKWDVENVKLYESGIEINNISRLLDCNKKSGSQYLYANLLNKYQEVLSANSVNHDELDYYVAKWAINKKNDCPRKIATLAINYAGTFPFMLITIISFGIDISLLMVISA